MEYCPLNALKAMARALSAHFGINCETAVYDLSPENRGALLLRMENGHVKDDKAETSDDTPEFGFGPADCVDEIGTLVRTKDGTIRKRSLLYFADESGERPRYAFMIRYDVTALLAFENALRSLTGPFPAEIPKTDARIPYRVEDVLDALIEKAANLIGKPVALMTREEKITAIRFLNEAGAFLITKSGDKVSKYFNVSKYLLYSCIEINK
ncbi:MAG: helix-turn-helix domain-containing protein [Fusobacteriaceae bacterium]|jgi:predicted transcriptional regulator YheO|nr:helix-turn-helix domain-containing protein [Fusobacteriaceae bacterium]